MAIQDGGYAAARAATAVAPPARCARDVWHGLARWGQTQPRRDRRVAAAPATLAIRDRYDATRAAGQRWRGRRPTPSAAAHAALGAQETALAEAGRFLGPEVRRVLEVVVLLRERVLDPAARRPELEAALALLADRIPAAPCGARTDLARLHTHLIQALPALLICAEPWAAVEATATAKRAAAGVGLLGWAGQPQAGLGRDADGVGAGLPTGGPAAARGLRAAWSDAGRTTSLVENWHSLVRAHLAVHRGLPPGLRARLAVWHNHRVVPRGQPAGPSPLPRSGLGDAPTDWLTALGYPPAAAAGGLVLFPTQRPVIQEVAA